MTQQVAASVSPSRIVWISYSIRKLRAEICLSFWRTCRCIVPSLLLQICSTHYRHGVVEPSCVDMRISLFRSSSHNAIFIILIVAELVCLPAYEPDG